MIHVPPRLSLLVLTEDGAARAHATLVALIKKMLLRLDPACGTHLVQLEPQNEHARKAMLGNLWKSRRPLDHPKIVLLGRAIAGKLLEQSVPGFVLFHVDGDVPWARRVDSENVKKFEAFRQQYVMPALDRALRTKQNDHAKPATDEQITIAARTALRKLLPLIPFYSIEAWLYQNTSEARRLCATTCGHHLERIDQWDTNPGGLDEIPQPKTQLCLEGRFNRDLAERSFPVERVLTARKSFAETVQRLLACDELCTALAHTRAASACSEG